MKLMAPGVWRLREFPLPITNCYLAGDVLIDAGRRTFAARILSELEGRKLSLVALTHVHPDHQGSAHAVCTTYHVPLACHADDVDAMEGRRPINEPTLDTGMTRYLTKKWQGPPHPVARVLREGDDVAGFRVVHAPGHSRGEVIFFRDSDRVAICGDVIRNISFVTLLPGIREPVAGLTYDIPENRRSIRKLANLNPSLILPGHGPAITDLASFERFVSRLPT